MAPEVTETIKAGLKWAWPALSSSSDEATSMVSPTEVWSLRI